MLYPKDLDRLTESIYDESFEDYCLKKYAKVLSQADTITDEQIMQAANEVKAEADRRKRQIERNTLSALCALFLLSKKRDKKLYQAAEKAGTITKVDGQYKKVLAQDELVGTVTGETIPSNFSRITKQELRTVIAPSYKTAQNGIEAAYQNVGYQSHVRYGKVEYKPVYKAYADAVAIARRQVQSGVKAYEQAISEAIDACEGLKAIQYDSGVNTSIEAAVRRAVMTGANQMAQDMNDKSIEALGAEYVEVSAHEGARPSHAEWQGKVYKIHGRDKKHKNLYEATGLGTVTGLLGANCRHTYYPFFPGISEPVYSKEELASLDPPPVTYNGKTYSYYEVTQRQRAYERAIRKTRKRIMMKEEAGLDLTKDKALLQKQMKNYKVFSKATGQWAKWGRTRVGKNNTKNTISVNMPAYLNQVRGSKKFQGDFTQYFKSELSRIPKLHADALQNYVKEIRVVDENEPSRYNRKTRILYLKATAGKGDLTHELGHALETMLELYNDPECKKVRDSGLSEKISVFSKEIKTEVREGNREIRYLDNEKFLSTYQGFINKVDSQGNEWITKDGNLNTNVLIEYFSEGYRYYCTNPKLLKKKDKALFDFIAGIS